MDDQKRDDKSTAADERIPVYADKATDDELSDDEMSDATGGLWARSTPSDDTSADGRLVGS